MEDAAQWGLNCGILPTPRVQPVRYYARLMKQAARRQRFHDPQGRIVRCMLAAKLERVDTNGNRIFDVMWNHLHAMDLNHALTAFRQRDEMIERQRRAATRDVESVVDNNPKVRGYEGQFKFAFMLEEPVELNNERIEETAATRVFLADADSGNDANPITRRKPR